ncbi:hypothetical protein C8J55DRAFT_526400 [Lentinula edodes]|uniref:N-acetyltransferase domain-containing protein n=1 Tax=Lentinula lateritia TaxID=40482 RepID=A0A9W8ZUE1_9AGAR|nr:hypothetical protein C8J55DRAFT_526400 [Lentinula edodes]
MFIDIITQASEITSRTGRIKLIQPVGENDSAFFSLHSHFEERRYLEFHPASVTPAGNVGKFRRGLHRGFASAVHEFHVLQCQPNGLSSSIGWTWVHRIDTIEKSCEAGIVVKRGGYTSDILYTLFSYVFEELQLHRVCIKTENDNLEMRGWLEIRAGAKLEIKEREAWTDLINGGYCNVVGYGILDWEWQNRIKTVLESRLGL